MVNKNKKLYLDKSGSSFTPITVEGTLSFSASRSPRYFVVIDPHSAKPHAICTCRCKYDGTWSWTANLRKASSLELASILAHEECDIWVEDTYLHKNFRTAKELSMSVGEIRMLCKLNNLRMIPLNPARWTSWCRLPHTMYAPVVSAEIKHEVDDDIAAAYLMMRYILIGGDSEATL